MDFALEMKSEIPWLSAELKSELRRVSVQTRDKCTLKRCSRVNCYT
jgi:hypothetical protein